MQGITIPCILVFLCVNIYGGVKMKLSNSEIVELIHQVQLEKVMLTELNCKKNSANVETQKIKPVDLEIETGVNSLNLEKREGVSFLKIIVSSKKNFKVEVKYEGVFSIKSSLIEMDKEALEYFLHIQAVPMLLSYARETVDMILLKMREEGARMPIINVSDLFNTKMREL